MLKKVLSKAVAVCILFSLLDGCTFAAAPDGDIYSGLTEKVDCENIGYNEEKEYFAEIYVSPLGNDENSGEKNSPFATVQRAQQEVRKINSQMTGDIAVHFDEGTYFISETIDFSSQDSGKNGFSVVYTGKKGKTIFSAGRRVSGFSLSKKLSGKNIYEARLSEWDDFEKIANLYVNGESKRLAETEELITAQPKPEECDNEAWYASNPLDSENNKYSYFDPETEFVCDGVYVKKSDLPKLENCEGAVISYERGYTSYNYPIKEIFENPYNTDEYVVRLADVWNEVFAEERTDKDYSFDWRYFKVLNVFELLDSEGEFWFDRAEKKLYYYAEAGEDMTCAEVIVPEQSVIMNIFGEGADDKVSNITFQDITFSHAKYTEWLEGSVFRIDLPIENRNGLMNVTNSTQSAVKIGFAENVNFRGNIFSNSGGGGIYAQTGYKNSVIAENVFSDLGSFGIHISSLNYGDGGVDRETGLYTLGIPNAGIMKKDERCDILALCGVNIETSYNSMVDCYEKSYVNGDYIETIKTTGMRVLQNAIPWQSYDKQPRKTRPPLTADLSSVMPKGAWKSAPDAEEKGEISFVKYDFGRKYSVDEIVLGFCEDYVTEDEKKGFEILLSNDKSFKAYERVAEQIESAEGIQSYKIETEEKFRYMMVRTKASTPFALSYAWVFTNDIKPFTQFERSGGLGISNNYFSQCGTNVSSSSALFAGYVSDCTIVHNEVCDMPYSGITLGGGGAAENFALENNYIAYNNVKNTNIVLEDGSGFYFAGNFKGSVIEKNYLSDINTAQFGFYTDSGFSDGILINNVSEGTVYSYSFYLSGVTSGTQRNYGRNMYANSSMIRNASQPDEANNNDLDTVIIELPGQLGKEAFVICKESGLEKEFSDIPLSVKKSDKRFYDYQRYAHLALYMPNFLHRHWNADFETAKNILQNGKFGTGIGRYSEEVGEALKDFVRNGKIQTASNLYELHEIVNEARNSAESKSLYETINICKELLVKEKRGETYICEDQKKALAELCGEYEGVDEYEMTAEELYTAVSTLENMYNAIIGEVSFKENYTPELKAINITKKSENNTATNGDVNNDVTVYPQNNYLRFIRDAGDEYITYDMGIPNTLNEKYYIKGVRINYGYYSPSAINNVYFWTPDSTEALSAKYAQNLIVGDCTFNKENRVCIGSVSLENTSYSTISGSEGEFCEKDILFTSPRAVKAGENLVLTSESPMYLRSFSFIVCSEEEVRNPYELILGATADFYSEETSDNAVPDININSAGGESYVRFVRNGAKRYVGYKNVDFGKQTEILRFNIRYAAASTVNLKIYEADETENISVSGGRLLKNGTEAEALLEVLLDETGGDMIFSDGGAEVKKALSGKKNLVFTTDKVLRINSFSFEFGMFAVGGESDGENFETFVKVDVKKVLDALSDGKTFIFLTGIYSGEMLEKVEKKLVDLSGFEAYVKEENMVLDLSGLKAGDYTAKFFLWNDEKSLMPVEKISTQSIVVK